MIIVSLLVCASTLLVFGVKSYMLRIRIKRFINSMKPEVKTATTISELLALNDKLMDFAFVFVKNTFKPKSFLYSEAKLLKVAINSKIELLDRL